MIRTDHVILTRFNLPSPGVESLVRARDGWLRDRIELFERYCAPSVAAQTNPGVHWIVYLDPESPSWLLDRIRPFADSGLLRPILRASVDREELLEDIRSTVGSPGDVLITSNLDNDDGLARDFSERLVGVASGHPRAAVYLTRGLVQVPGSVYLNTDRHNAFCSVRETWEAPITCWVDYHNELPRLMPTVVLDGPPGWLQVIHGANVSNRLRGRLVSPAAYRDLFDGLLDADEPPVSAVVRDRLVGHPARSARDTLRSTMRFYGTRLMGKERYGRLKYLLSVRGRAA